MSVISKLLFGLCLVIVVGSALIVGRCEIRTRRYEAAFEKIENGNSKHHVSEILGQPNEVVTCNVDEQCKDIHIYDSFMERWGYVFGKDDSVTDKFYNVSY